QIAHIDGSGEYLIALRNAYRGHIKNLTLARRAAEAEIYARRLAILEHGPPLDADEKKPAPTLSAPKSAAPDNSGLKVRAKIDTSPPRPAPAVGEAVGDPFDTANNKRLTEARALLDRADAEFRGEHYDKAGELYALAHQAVP